MTTNSRMKIFKKKYTFCNVMQDKLLYNLVEDIAGEGNGRIVEMLFNKKDVNEFLIAKKMDLTINQVRNILYKLSNFGLVSFIRKKDQKKGWYIYYWTLNNEKSLALIQNYMRKKIDALEEQLNNRETKRYYTCPYCHIEVSEDVALENGFSCDECAEIYKLTDNTPFVRDIKSKITRLNNEITEIEKELDDVREKERKKIDRQNKKIASKKEEEKNIKKLATAKKRKETMDAKRKVLAENETDIVKKKTSTKKVPVKKVSVKKTPEKKTSTKKKSEKKA